MRGEYDSLANFRGEAPKVDKRHMFWGKSVCAWKRKQFHSLIAAFSWSKEKIKDNLGRV
jgi:hypothetical protein